MGQNRGGYQVVVARPSSLSFPVAFVMAAAINVFLGRAFVEKKKHFCSSRFVTTIA